MKRSPSPRVVTAWAVVSAYFRNSYAFFALYWEKNEKHLAIYETKKPAIKLCARLNSMVNCYHVVRLTGKLPGKRGKR